MHPIVDIATLTLYFRLQIHNVPYCGYFNINSESTGPTKYPQTYALSPLFSPSFFLEKYQATPLPGGYKSWGTSSQTPYLPGETSSHGWGLCVNVVHSSSSIIQQ